MLVSNHPQLAGGSHLPDITVITPVFAPGAPPPAPPVFFVASRGHHADIGGISPGSMPPASKRLEEEGAAIVSFKLVRRGAFQVGAPAGRGGGEGGCRGSRPRPRGWRRPCPCRATARGARVGVQRLWREEPAGCQPSRGWPAGFVNSCGRSCSAAAAPAARSRASSSPPL